MFTNATHKLKQFAKKRHKWLVSLLLIFCFVTVTMGYWIANSASGLQILLSSITRISSGAVVFEGVQGKLGILRVDKLHFSNDSSQLVIRHLELNWNPSQLFAGKLFINQLSIETVTFHSQLNQEPEEETTASLPETLNLPIAVAIQKLEVGKFSLFSENKPDAVFMVNDLSLRFVSDGRNHQLANMTTHSEFGLLNASANVAGHYPFELTSQVSLNKSDQWGVLKVILNGNLEQLNIHINGDGTGITGDITAQLQPYAISPIKLLNISLERLNPSKFISDIPDINLSVLADLSTGESQNLMGDVVVTNDTMTSLDNGGLPFSEIKAGVQLSDGRLQFDNIYIYLPDEAIVSGQTLLNIEDLSVEADLNVNKLNPLMLDNRLREANVSGSIKLDGDSQSQNIIIQLKDDKFNFNANITQGNKTVFLHDFHLSHLQSQLNGQGKLDFVNEHTFDFTGNLDKFNLSDFVDAPSTDLNVALTLTGKTSPQLTGVFNYTIKESYLAQHSVSGNGQITFKNLDQLTTDASFLIGTNHIQAEGSFGSPGEVLKIDILTPSLEQIGFGFSGYLKSQWQLGGSFESPEFNFDIDSKQLKLPDDFEIESLSAKGTFNDDEIALMLQAKNFSVDNEIKTRQLKLNLKGQKSQHQFYTEIQFNDDTNVYLHALGGVAPASSQDAKKQWLGQLSKLSVTGLIPIQLQSPVPLEVSTERILLGLAQLSIAGGKANINQVLWTPQHWQSDGNFNGIAVQYGSELVAKEDRLHLGGVWNFESGRQLEGKLKIIREKGDWYSPGEFPLPVGLQELVFTVEAKNQELTGKINVLSEFLGQADAQFVLPISQSSTKWDISSDTPLEGKIFVNSTDLSWINLIVDDNIRSNGKFELSADITGTINNPKVQGNIVGENLALSLLDQGLQLEQGHLIAHFDRSNLHIEQLNFSAPFEKPPRDRLLGKIKVEDKPGSLAISGTIGLSDDTHHVDVTIEQLPLSSPSHYWILLSGNGRANIQNNLLSLKGRIAADAGLLMQPPSGYPQLADDIIIGEESNDDKQQVPLTDIDVTLDLGRYFYLRASGLEGQLAGQLHVSNDPRKLLNVTGTIATKNASFTAYGQKLKVKRGIVNFQGSIDDPGLNVLAVRTGLPVEAGVEVMGSVLHPKVRLVSEPNVPDSEKLSWVVLGRSMNTGGVDSALLLTAAGSILGGQSSGGGITQQLSDALGVDEISFRQGETGNPLGGQIGTVGKRLSSRAYISYERGLTSTTAGVTKLTYNLTPKIKVETRAGVDSAVDMFYIFRFD
ncbi:MAG: translocation/assembly module TamB domain-containing protein [Nitrosomonas sp.]|nr:translocation/assembly module TamB domain-containing protein [Nitrosomonas sp.]